MKKVKSSNVDSYNYDPSKKILTVTFNSGKTYDYHEVHPHEYDALEKAPSIGSHLHQNIFQHKRVVKR